MKTKILYFVVILMMCCSLVSCSVTEDLIKPATDSQVTSHSTDNQGIPGPTERKDYVFISENGKHYITFENISSYEEDVQGAVEAGVYFKDIHTLKNTVLNGTLTIAEKKIVSRFSKDEKGNIKTCDFNNLYIPILPEGEFGKVYWTGEDYYFPLSLKEDLQGTVICYAKDSYDSAYKHRCEDFFKENDSLIITKTETVDNKTVTEYCSDTSDICSSADSALLFFHS